MSAALTAPVSTTAAATPPPRGALARLLHDPLALVSLVVLVFVVLVSVFAPLLAPFGPNQVIAGLARQPPGDGHLMGGDGAGRDVLSRLLFSGRITLLGAVVTAVVAVAIGVPAGLAAGYFGRWFDGVGSWVANVLIAIPGMVILLAVISAVGPRTVPVMAIFGVLISPAFFRLVRTAVMGVRDELYVDAARISGLSDARIIGRHILAVVRAPIIIQASITAGIAVLMQTGIQFLGLGDPNVASWGQMLSDAFTNIYAAPTLVVWPGLTITVTVAALALLGNAVRDAVTDRPVAARPRRRPVTVASPAGSTPVDPEALVQVRDLSISYPTDGGEREVVSGVSLSIGRGEVLGLVGESGSGKTQTAFAVLGLLPGQARITAGDVLVDGSPASARQRARLRGDRIAYIPQEPMSNLDPSFTVGYQLTEPLRARLGFSRVAARQRALDLLARVGIPDPQRTFDAYPHQISGGMAQRVLIAGAVACDPDVLIADEPTTALDVTVQAEVLDLLRELQRERGMGLLLVTHNFGVVADVCDRVAVMQHGRIVEQAAVADIFTAPQHEYTRMLLDSVLDEDGPARPPLSDTHVTTEGTPR